MHSELSALPKRRVATVVVTAAALMIIGGCPTSSTNIDLAENGVLELVISRDSNDTDATVSASITDSSVIVLNDKVILRDDQVLSVNDETLDPTTRTELGLDSVYTATIDIADEYTVSFDNQGVETTVDITALAEFDDVSPDDGDTVTYDGFLLEWEASDISSVFVDITITGTALYGNTDGSYEYTDYSVSLTDLSDDGDATIGADDLSYFQPGSITVTLSRNKTLSEDLGFSDGEIMLQIVRELSLTLSE